MPRSLIGAGDYSGIIGLPEGDAAELVIGGELTSEDTLALYEASASSSTEVIERLDDILSLVLNLVDGIAGGA